MIYEVDLAKNAMSYLNGEGEITTEVAQRPITQVSEKDLSYLEAEGVIAQNKVSSGLKIMLQNPDSSRSLTPFYLLNLKTGKSISIFGLMIINGPCK
jgi:hypothetical protein